MAGNKSWKRISDIIPVTRDGRKIVTPLQKLLRDLPLEDIFHLLDVMKVRYTLTGNEKVITQGGKPTNIHRMKIFRDGEIFAQASGDHGLKNIVADVVAKMLSKEDRDFHDLQDLRPDNSLEIYDPIYSEQPEK